jgi:hypothetical protein
MDVLEEVHVPPYELLVGELPSLGVDFSKTLIHDGK